MTSQMLLWFLIGLSVVSSQDFELYEKFVYKNKPEDAGGEDFERMLATFPTQRNKPNLLVIMTDQQRFDALSFAGNSILKTPHMDRLAREGVYFKNAYTSAPVCGPARVSLLTGLGIENTGVTTNDLPGKANLRTYDMKLVQDEGYVAEYYGKWHSPQRLSSVYRNTLDTGSYNLFGPYWRFLNSRGYKTPENPLRPGLVADTMTGQGYKPVRLDSRFYPKNRNTQPNCECDQFGVHKIRPVDTLTAFEGRNTLHALNRLGGPGKRPFSLHVSFNSPHAPHTPVGRYAKLYRKNQMPVPPSINDTMSDSPYFFLRKPQFSNPNTIGHFLRLYYAQVKEVDHWVGRILSRLDMRGLTNNTLVVFTSDHGEMMGSHGFIEKGVLYEESAHIPLLMRFPGRIPPGTVVNQTVSHHDVFATILDYMGAESEPSDGHSLRDYIENKPSARPEYIVVETGGFYQQFMIRSGDWKLIIPNKADSKWLNVLYNLKDDPHETSNLIGFNQDRGDYLAKANELKELLSEWCIQTGSPHTTQVQRRIL